MEDLTEFEAAVELAINAHDNQYRKGGMPYIIHPLRVASKFGEKQLRERSVAVLHDVLEDTLTEMVDFRTYGISDEVLDVVIAMTKIKGETYENYLERVKSNELARVVKIEDIKDNMEDLKVYLLSESESDRKWAERKIKQYEDGLEFLMR